MRATKLSLVAGLLLTVGMMITPALADAQIKPLNLSQIERLFVAGVGVSQILQTAREACIDFRLDTEGEQLLTRAGATTAFIMALRDVCHRPPGTVMGPTDQQVAAPPRPAVPTLRFDPGSAMARSFVLPGLGQFYTGRHALGVAFMAGWAGALGYGFLSKERVVECFQPTQEECPQSQVRAVITRRPMLAVGAGAAGVIALISGFEARAAARRGNRSQTTPRGSEESGDGPTASSLATIISGRPEGGVSLGLRITVH
jgi:hypothetical protein